MNTPQAEPQMAPDNQPIRIEIRIDRASARRILILGVALLVFGAIGVAFAAPISNQTFTSNQVLTAKQLTDNFGNIEDRLNTLAAIQPTQFVQIVASVKAPFASDATSASAEASCPAGFKLVMTSVTSVYLSSTGLGGWENGVYDCSITPAGNLLASIGQLPLPLILSTASNARACA